ncbi:MAG: phosphatase PAP2 family protein [Sphingobacteriaceae bacterium]|nr:phosphatase PAP2 family protein [Sphingobacteriaceae bacterium]
MFETLEHIDRAILLAINGAHHPVLDVFFWHASAEWIFIPFWLLVIWYIHKQRGIKYLGTVLLCVAFIILFCDQSTNIVKHSVKRYRPTHNLEIQDQVHIVNNYRGGQYGFFSGHSSNNTGVAVFLFLVLTQLKCRYRYWIFFFPPIIEYSRMYLGVHYPSDILVGTLDGILFGIIFYKVFQYLSKKWNVEAA